METIYVQFSDSKKTSIVALFSSPQNPEHYPNLGEVDLSDSRYAEYLDAVPKDTKELWPAPDAGS